MSLEDMEATEMRIFFYYFFFSMDIYPSTQILKTIILSIDILITKKITPFKL